MVRFLIYVFPGACREHIHCLIDVRCCCCCCCVPGPRVVYEECHRKTALERLRRKRKEREKKRKKNTTRVGSRSTRCLNSLALHAVGCACASHCNVREKLLEESPLRYVEPAWRKSAFDRKIRDRTLYMYGRTTYAHFVKTGVCNAAASGQSGNSGCFGWLQAACCDWSWHSRSSSKAVGGERIQIRIFATRNSLGRHRADSLPAVPCELASNTLCLQPSNRRIGRSCLQAARAARNIPPSPLLHQRRGEREKEREWREGGERGRKEEGGGEVSSKSQVREGRQVSEAGNGREIFEQPLSHAPVLDTLDQSIDVKN